MLTGQAIALQTRHIVDTMNSKGHKIDSIYMSGTRDAPGGAQKQVNSS